MDALNLAIYEEVKELAKEVMTELTTRGLKIAIAESCTGGLATSFITDFDGSSEVLDFSVITYSQDAKEEFLGIPSYVIDSFGTISLECAKLMAEGVSEYEVDFGLATTGVIGESIENKLKGTAFIAINAAGQQTFVKELTLDPNLPRYQLKLEITKHLFLALLEAIDSIY